MSGKKSISGPYRATKLWNDAVRAFYNGMPVCRHWRGLRQYERCFTGTEAIDWLHVHLQSNPNFDSSVSRDQTTKLLRKFLKSGLIEDVRGNVARSEDFKDNKELYRFSNKSPLKALHTPRTPGRIVLGTINSNNANHYLDINDGSSPALKQRWDPSPKQRIAEDEKVLRRTRSGSRLNAMTRKVTRVLGENAANEAKDNGGMQECRVIAKPPTKEETDNVWKQVFLDKLDVVCNRLLFGDVSTLLDPDVVSGEFVRHNMTQITARGVVQAPEGHPDDLPNWILTAMKCMAHWPNTADSSCNIPNYPGVERDVFKIVRDFFTNMAVPLIPYDLYEAIIRLYIGAEFLDITKRSANVDGEDGDNCKENEGSYIHGNLEGGDSVENLILNMSISSQQKTSTPYLENGSISSEENFPFGGKRRSIRKAEANKDRGNELHHTPVHYYKEKQNLTIPQSLKLRRLKNYTDFKEDNLYPTLLEGSCEASALGTSGYSLEKSQTYAQPNKSSCESIVSKQAETVRSVKTNDLARRMKRESKEATLENTSLIRSNEITGVTLPQNCCFETAFTSDSPKTRIIPQKSVDTIHFRDSEKLKPRPMSIAVTSLVGFDSRSSDNIWDTTRGENISLALNLGTSSVLSTTVDGKFVTAPIHSPLSRSRSAGNLQSLDNDSTSQRPRESPRSTDNPYKSLALKLRDSVKRKNTSNALVSLKKISQSRGDHHESNVKNIVRRLRTKSGGYMNPGLATEATSMEETRSIQSHISDKELDSGLSHFRTKSGGFLNLALVPSNNSLDQTSFDTISSTPTPHLDSSDQDGSHCSVSRFSQEGYNHLATAHPSHVRCRSATPHGCLSHVLSSSSSLCSSGRSVYYSACSYPSRNSTPSLPCQPLPERRSNSAMDKGNISSYRTTVKEARRVSVNDVDVAKHLSSSANELSDGWADRTPYGQVPPYAQGGVWRHYHSSPSKRLIGRKKGIENFFGSKACLPGLLTREGKEAAIGSSQLLLLMLNPVWRRKLHLLLRMMNKMSNNDKLNICDKQTTRATVLNTFTRSILLCDQEADYDELLSLRIVSFMMDNHEEIMRPPQDMAVLVHRKLTQIQRSQIVYDSTVWDRSMTLTYCQQVSQVQYERQRMTGSQQFLTQLLDQIITNDKLSNKEKRKKLKEFKSLYPETYKERFPTEVPEKTENRGRKLRNFMKFSSLTSLGRSRTLRL